MGIPFGSCHNFRGRNCGGRHERPWWWRGEVPRSPRRPWPGKAECYSSTSVFYHSNDFPPPPPPCGGHSNGTALEFVVELHGIPRGHLHLPRPFTRAMEAAKPPVLWLRAHGCSHGAMEVHMEYRKRRSMFLGRGWKAFARAHNLEDEHVLCFNLAEDNMLSVKFYGRSGVCLGCCEES
ncbi:l-ascorbate oxidase-like protein [Hordeum vulgare]|nr:l-ascorbate oxidase-like protein [Hordeum vulgare]